MQLWQLRTFSAVAKNLHFRRAAEELNLSQPAVSHQIKSLEDEIGEPLFLREKDGIFLTKTGQTMYEHANKILNIADEMRFEIRENEEFLNGKLFLGVVTRGLSHTFLEVYKEFKKIYPQIEVTFQIENKFDDVIEKIRAGSIDIGLISHIGELKGLVSIPYGEYELLLTVGKNHPFAEKGEISIDELAKQEWVLFEPGNKLRETIENILREEGIPLKIGYETNDATIVRQMIMHDNKISFVPEWGILEDLQEGKLVKVKIKGKKYKVQVYLVWKASRRTKVMSATLSFLLEETLQGIYPIKDEEDVYLTIH